MPPETTKAKLRWEDGDLPVSTQFDDPYYSRSDGLSESRHVFLNGNDLPERLDDARDFHIAELGFGTGLNMLAAADLWTKQDRGTTLRLTSFERYPLTTSEIERALSHWPELAGLADMLVDQWPGKTIIFPQTELTIIVGDVAETLPAWEGSVDAWFLDGFAPSRNPQMWTHDVLDAVGKRTRPGGSFATYTAAGFVRRNLQAAGFLVQKRKGFGSKREMLTGYKH
jgi:tRNA U34 5-methylaminomethyl-2-thiouridine-forming methyltransferase MnmC